MTNREKYFSIKLHLSKLVKMKLRKVQTKRGDFVFNTRNSPKLIGKVTYIEDSHPSDLLFNNNLMRIRFKSMNRFQMINYQFKSQFVKDQLNEYINATTSVAAITLKIFLTSMSSSRHQMNRRECARNSLPLLINSTRPRPASIVFRIF